MRFSNYFLTIFIVAVAVSLKFTNIIAADKSEIINNYNSNPRDIVEFLYGELKEKQYDKVNKYLSVLAAEKPMTKDGIRLLEYMYGYLANMIDERTITAWCNPKVVSHSAYIVRGKWYVNKAWEARGTDWGYTVSDEREDIKDEYINLAQIDFELAYKMNPFDPNSSASMITVSTAKGFPKEVMELWFQRAVQADALSSRAYERKLNYLKPIWYGNQREMKEFAEYCYENSPAGSTVHKIMLHYIFDTAYSYKRKGRSAREYIEQPDVSKIIKDIYNKLDKEFPLSTDTKSSKAFYYSLLGRKDDALRLYNDIVEEEPKEVWGYYRRGNFYFNANMYNEAESDYSKVISIKPEWAITYYLMSLIYQRRDSDYNKAIEYIDKSINISPNSKIYYFAKGSINMDHNKYDLAIQNFSDCLKIDPYYSHAHESRGLAYESLNQLEKAMDDFLNVKELNGGDDPGIDWLLTRVQDKMKTENRNAQIAQFVTKPQVNDNAADEKIVPRVEKKEPTLTPEDIDQLIELGKKNFYLRKADEAKALFSQVLAADPMHGYVNYMMGQLADKIEYDYGLAVEYYSKAILQEKNNETYLFDRGKAHYMLRNYQEGVSDFDRVIAIIAVHGKAHYYRALCYDGLGNAEAAVKDMQLASNFDPDLSEEAGKYLQRHVQRDKPKVQIQPAEELKLVAEENMRMNRYDQAEINWLEILKIDPREDHAYFNLGLIAINRDRDQKKAIYYFSKAIDINKSYVSYYYYRAHSYKFVDDCEKAINDCNNILNLDKKYSGAYFLRAECFEINGDFVNAQSDYNSAKKYDPSSTNSVNARLAELSAKTGEIAPELTGNADFLIKRSDSYLADKEFELAITDLNAAIKLDPENSTAYYKLGVIYADKFRDHEKAIQYFTKAANLNDSKTEYTFQRGLSYYALQSWELASKDFTPTIAKNPSEGRAYYYRGMCSKKLNEKDRAIEDLIKAKELDPSWAEGVDRELETMM